MGRTDAARKYGRRCPSVATKEANRRSGDQIVYIGSLLLWTAYSSPDRVPGAISVGILAPRPESQRDEETCAKDVVRMDQTVLRDEETRCFPSQHTSSFNTPVRIPISTWPALTKTNRSPTARCGALVRRITCDRFKNKQGTSTCEHDIGVRNEQ